MAAVVDPKLLPAELQEKLNKLETYLTALGSLAVGFSGGVDSAFLLAAAHHALADRVIAVTGADASVPERELREARAFCAQWGIRHIVCKLDPLREEGYRRNSPDRCYYCKRGLFTEMQKIADDNGVAFLAEGSNTDDLGDYRPGLRAAAEMNVKSPLRDVGFSKQEIRLLSRAMGLPTWNKPAYACLASRFVYGEEITEEKLRRIDRAEQALIDLGFFEERVRLHGSIARIEVPPQDIPLLASDEIREHVYSAFKEIGFSFVTLDLKGYVRGSMNATI